MPRVFELLCSPTGIRRIVLCTAIAAGVHFGQQNSHIDSTRPTISSDAAIQQRGALQVEAGYDGYFLPYDQTQALCIHYAVTNRLRLDNSEPGSRSTDMG